MTKAFVNPATGKYLLWNGKFLTPPSSSSIIVAVKNLALKNNFHILLIKNNDIWAWGYNVSGQLGINVLGSKSTPVLIVGAKKTFCQIGGGTGHSIGLDKNGKVWGWGYNAYGQLGINTTTNCSTPTAILGVNKTFCKISSGYNYSSGIDKYGKVWSWGNNIKGELGINSVVYKSTPTAILGVNKTFCYISAGDTNSFGIDKNNQVWSWGNNTSGKLGINSTTSKSTPTAILGVKKTFCHITGGGTHSIGLDKNGKIWCWGLNTSGQLGQNNVTSRRTPYAIAGVNKTFCMITASNTSSFGIDKYGKVWSWGLNNNGELGINSTVNKSTPTTILGVLKTFCNITGGLNTILALDKNNNIWGWGQGTVGQLDNNNIINYSTPVLINI